MREGRLALSHHIPITRTPGYLSRIQNLFLGLCALTVPMLHSQNSWNSHWLHPKRNCIDYISFEEYKRNISQSFRITKLGVQALVGLLLSQSPANGFLALYTPGPACPQEKIRSEMGRHKEFKISLRPRAP